jgi:endonuclease/exonuclease/phosphatase family metal-dependent hydrolase
MDALAISFILYLRKTAQWTRGISMNRTLAFVVSIGSYLPFITAMEEPPKNVEITFTTSEIPYKPKDALRIMTYNIRRQGKETVTARSWKNRLPLIKKLIDLLQPDIIGFQEVFAPQYDDLKAILPTFDAFGDNARTNWWGLAPGEATPIFYDPTKVTALDHETFPVNEIEVGLLGWMPWDRKKTGLLSRICTGGKFKHKKNNNEFYVYNTHLDHKYEEARLLSATVIKEHMEQKKHTAFPLILMGDLNMEFEGKLAEHLTGF